MAMPLADRRYRGSADAMRLSPGFSLVYLFRANCNSAPSDPQLEAATRGRFEHTAIERLYDESADVLLLALRPKR